VLRGQKVDAGEYLLVRPDGTRTPVLLTAAPVRGPSGELRGGVLTFQDLSARQELERLKEEYVGLISHDLRTPLQTLSLRLELLLRQLRARELQTETATAESLQRSVHRMGGMIDELLEGTRLESGRVELNRAPVELQRLLAEVLERDVPPSERERFQLECPTAPRPVLADAARLTRVVVNLLTNALKYSSPGSLVEVRLVDEDARVVVTVKDSGPGLRPEEATHLFQKYYRTRSTARKSEGLGLGLYISRLIVEAHGGRIWVESTPGQGAAFSFSLPREPPGPPAAREVR
jgi:signal transduction histidine kinase